MWIIVGEYHNYICELPSELNVARTKKKHFVERDQNCERAMKTGLDMLEQVDSES